MEKKKIGLIGAILMGIGCIVGSGIFGTMPTVAAEYGPGIVYALLGAAVVVILRAMSLLYTSSALPTTAAQFAVGQAARRPWLFGAGGRAAGRAGLLHPVRILCRLPAVLRLLRRSRALTDSSVRLRSPSLSAGAGFRPGLRRPSAACRRNTLRILRAVLRLLTVLISSYLPFCHRVPSPLFVFFLNLLRFFNSPWCFPAP